MSGRWLFLALLFAATPAWTDPAPMPQLVGGGLKRPVVDKRTPVRDALTQQAKSAATVVADIDGRTVTLGDVADAIAELPPGIGNLPFASLFPSVVSQLVRQQALVIRAHQQGLDEDPVTQRRVKAATDRILANELLRLEISQTLTEQALLERYDREVAGKPVVEEAHVRVIMAPTASAAQGIIKELQAGVSFALLAQRASLDGTAPAGGDLGFVRLEGLNAEVGAVAFSMRPGEFTPFPFRSAGGWFVVRVEERRTSPTPSFSEMRERLVQAMLGEGVADVTTRALADTTVHTFDISGKEIIGDELK